jgi:glycosyltransferase involved in cell wall biosynthesis
MRLKIGFVCGEYPPALHGGIGTFTQVMGRALAARGHEVRVVGVYPPGRDAPAWENDRGVSVWRIAEPDHPFGWLRARAQLFRTIRHWARCGAVDLIEVPDYQGWAAGWPALPVPVVVRAHGSATYFAAETGQSVRPLDRWLERASIRRADAWCAVSRYAGEITARVLQVPPPIGVLYNPVEPPPPAPGLRARSLDVVFSGTLTEKKGIVQLLRAWPQVCRAVPGTMLHVYGKEAAGTAEPSAHERVERLVPAAERASVRLHGHVDRARLLSALRAARAAVFPSYSEAFAIAPLEAMAQGCPTVASVRGAGPELAGPEAAALLVEPDRPDEIASALVRVLTDDLLATRLSLAGHSAVSRRFAVDHVVQDNEAFYARSVRPDAA